MSYHRRFVWTRVHRPVLQTFILVFLCLVCIFNLFLITSGSISHTRTQNIEINSVSPQQSQIESIDLDDPSVINNSETTERTRTIYDENEIGNFFQQVPHTRPASQEHSVDSVNLKEAESMLKEVTEKSAEKKRVKSKSKTKTSRLDKKDEIFVQLKEQDEKLGIHNIDTELDLTTVENATETEQQHEKEVRTTQHPSRANEDYENDEEFSDEELVETIILNADKPGIRELPFCKEGPAHTNGGHGASAEDQMALVKKNGLWDGKLIVIATLDGQISFLDQSGQLQWSFNTGSFFSSTISSMQLTENGKLVKLIPSLTGGLYKFDGKNLAAMPVTADSLLRKSFKMAADVVITGGREMKTFGINLKSGGLKYECGMDGCKSSADSKVESTSATANDDEDDNIVLVVKKNLQTIRAIESSTGTERWNFSVATHELALAGITKGCHQGATVPIEGSERNHSAITQSFRMMIPEGLVFGADEGNKIVWQHKFETPISQAWVFENGQLTIIDPMKCTPMMDEAPSLYVGNHKQQFYVQESRSTATKIRTAYELTNIDAEDHEGIDRMRIEWKPLTIAIRDENTALSPIYDGPFYVYEREEVVYPAIEHNGSANAEDKCDKDDPQEPEDSPLVESGIVLTIATLMFYWKEVLGISLLTALILMIPVVRIVRNRTTRQLLGYFLQKMHEMHIWHQTQQEENQRALVVYRNSSDDTALSNATLTTALNSSSSFDTAGRRRRTTSSSSNHSFTDDQMPFVSQYIKEFEPIQCLGRGGFGVVFEARKKIDDRCYAVKRIPLPNRAKSRDRVMREVKALAKLDHRNIVRYFNAWIENPPVGWLEKYDPLWNQCIVSSPSPTSEYPSEFGGNEESLRNFGNKLRKDYYEISLAGFTPDKEAADDNDDSFIVFAASEEEEAKSDDGQAMPNVNKSAVEVIDIPTPSHLNSEKTFLDASSISDKKRDGFWKSVDSNSNDSDINGDSIEHSKFFVRPITLDIPSSSSNISFNHSSGTDNETSESPLGLMYLYIQQELCQKSTLQEWLVVEKERDMRQVMKMFIQIVEAVEYIHSNRLIHRDLKPSNIFLAGGNTSNSITDIDETGDQSKEMTVKIGDFGLVTTSDVSKLPEENCDTGVEDEAKANAKLTGLVGTTLYMSYEQSQRKSYDHKVDIYSLGLILFEMIVPFSTNMERYELLSKVRSLELPQAFVKNYPDEYKLIRKMVSHNPTSRPEASEIKFWLNEHLKTLNAETHIIRTSSNWHRSKSAPSQDHKVNKILKAHSFI